MASVLRPLFRVFLNIVPRYVYEWTVSLCIWIHRFIVYLERPVSVPRSLEISYHVFLFVHIQVKVLLVAPFCEVIDVAPSLSCVSFGKK